jgi:hypothetical protein
MTRCCTVHTLSAIQNFLSGFVVLIIFVFFWNGWGICWNYMADDCSTLLSKFFF